MNILQKQPSFPKKYTHMHKELCTKFSVIWVANFHLSQSCSFFFKCLLCISTFINAPDIIHMHKVRSLQIFIQSIANDLSLLRKKCSHCIFEENQCHGLLHFIMDLFLILERKNTTWFFYIWFICIYVSAHNDLNHRRKRLLVKFTPALRQNVRTWGRLELYLDNLGELIKCICTSQPLVWWCDRTGAWHSNNFFCSAFVNAFHLSGYQWVLPFMCLLS